MYDLFTLILENSKSQHIALKILTAESHGVENPVFEMEILKHISTADRNHAGYNHVIHLLDNFQHSGPNGQHLCLVFQVMGETVGSLRRRCPNRQIPVVLAKKIAQQLLLGLDYLHRSCGVIHTGPLVSLALFDGLITYQPNDRIDIKPGNILLEIDKVEDVIQKLKQSSHGRNEFLSAAMTPSEALITGSTDSLETVNVRIVDFGVGMW